MPDDPDLKFSSEAHPLSVDQEKSEPHLQRHGLGDREFDRIYEEHLTEVLRYAIRCVGRREIAEELTSEAFLRLYRERDRIEPATAVGWLVTTVKNLATDYWRRSAVERRHGDSLLRSAKQPACETGEESYLLEHRTLKPEHRVCLTLRYVHGMERAEISSHTGMSDNRVKSCLQYGLRLLRGALEGRKG